MSHLFFMSSGRNGLASLPAQDRVEANTFSAHKEVSHAFAAFSSGGPILPC